MHSFGYQLLVPDRKLQNGDSTVVYTASFGIYSGGCNGSHYFEFGCLGGGQLLVAEDTFSNTAYDPVCGPHATLGDSFGECTIGYDDAISSAVV